MAQPVETFRAASQLLPADLIPGRAAENTTDEAPDLEETNKKQRESHREQPTCSCAAGVGRAEAKQGIKEQPSLKQMSVSAQT